MGGKLCKCKSMLPEANLDDIKKAIKEYSQKIEKLRQSCDGNWSSLAETEQTSLLEFLSLRWDFLKQLEELYDAQRKVYRMDLDKLPSPFKFSEFSQLLPETQKEHYANLRSEAATDTTGEIEQQRQKILDAYESALFYYKKLTKTLNRQVEALQELGAIQFVLDLPQEGSAYLDALSLISSVQTKLAQTELTNTHTAIFEIFKVLNEPEESKLVLESVEAYSELGENEEMPPVKKSRSMVALGKHRRIFSLLYRTDEEVRKALLRSKERFGSVCSLCSSNAISTIAQMPDDKLDNINPIALAKKAKCRLPFSSYTSSTKEEDTFEHPDIPGRIKW